VLIALPSVAEASPRCEISQDSLSKYGNMHALRRDADTGCAAVTQRTVSSKQFTTNPVDGCLDKIFGHSCNPAKGDADCLAAVGSTSFPLLPKSLAPDTSCLQILRAAVSAVACAASHAKHTRTA